MGPRHTTSPSLLCPLLLFPPLPLPSQKTWSPNLHVLPCFSLQSSVQQLVALAAKFPGSHSSPRSVLKLPHIASLGSGAPQVNDLRFRPSAGFSLGLNDRAQRPVVLFSALSFFLSALSFFQRPVIFREPFGFFGLSSALFWAWSCRKRPIKAKGGAIFVHHVVTRVGHRRHLGFTMNINLCKLVRPVVFQD